MPVEDCPERRAAQESGEIQGVLERGFRIRGRAGHTWAMGGLERKGES